MWPEGSDVCVGIASYFWGVYCKVVKVIAAIPLICWVGIRARLVRRCPINLTTSAVRASTFAAKACNFSSVTKPPSSSFFKSAIFLSTVSNEAILSICFCKSACAFSRAAFKAAISSEEDPPCPALSNASLALSSASCAAVLALEASVLASAIEVSKALTLEFNSSSEAFLSSCPCKSLMSSS